MCPRHVRIGSPIARSAAPPATSLPIAPAKRTSGHARGGKARTRSAYPQPCTARALVKIIDVVYNHPAHEDFHHDADSHHRVATPCRPLHAGATANLKLTFHLDHSAGADHATRLADDRDHLLFCEPRFAHCSLRIGSQSLT